MKVKVYSIKYDLSDSGLSTVEERRMVKSLPKSMIVDITANEEDLENVCVDKVSDITGWCVSGACFKVLGEKKNR